jgi:HopA1 effector protein family
LTAYREQLAHALRAAAVTSPTSFAWFGSSSRPLPGRLAAALPPDTLRAYLVDALGRELYRSFYSQGRPVPAQRDRGAPARPDDAFVGGLSAANTGSGGWEAGWKIRWAERGIVEVERSGLRVRARAADCRAAAGPRDPGTPVSVRRPKELGASSPGFYVALGDAALAPGREDVEVRVYFNTAAAGAAPLVATCTQLLNDARIPFALKVLDHPTGYTRCDAAVLYLAAGGFERARDPLATIVSACRPHLRGDAPAFAKPIASGVSVGEHRPSLGASFGSSRCRLLAEGIVVAHERGKGGLSDRLDTVARRFRAHGLDIDAPYLVEGSSARYAL